jgi:hypothetical protein
LAITEIRVRGSSNVAVVRSTKVAVGRLASLDW